MARKPAFTAHHERLIPDTGITISSDRAFGLVFAAVFALGWVVPFMRGGRANWWALGCSGSFVITAFSAPRLLHPINMLWAKLAILLHRIVSPVTAALVFYCVFTPMGLLLRALGKDLLRLRRDSKADSYWVLRDAADSPPDAMIRQF